MNEWKISEAKARFSEMVARVREAPQIIFHRNRPVAAVVRVEDLDVLRACREESERPSLRELLEEVQGIRDEGDLEIPPRRNRVMPEWD